MASHQNTGRILNYFYCTRQLHFSPKYLKRQVFLFKGLKISQLLHYHHRSNSCWTSTLFNVLKAQSVLMLFMSLECKQNYLTIHFFLTFWRKLSFPIRFCVCSLSMRRQKSCKRQWLSTQLLLLSIFWSWAEKLFITAMVCACISSSMTDNLCVCPSF